MRKKETDQAIKSYKKTRELNDAFNGGLLLNFIFNKIGLMTKRVKKERKRNKRETVSLNIIHLYL